MQNQFQQLSRPARRASASHITGAGIARPAVKVETGPLLQGKSMPNAHGKVMQRFQVTVQPGNNFDQRQVPIKDIKFKDRPPSTYLEGGDPRGATRHVIAVQLEFAAIKNLYVGKTIEQAAQQLGGPATIENVETRIKAFLVNHKDKRLHYQGSAEGNSKLEAVAQQGFSLMSQSRDRDGIILDREKFQQGVKLAYLGTLDIPPQRVRQGREEQLLASINLHRKVFKTAHNVPEGYLPDEGIALKLLHYDGDNYAAYAYSQVQAIKSGAPSHQASAFGHFTLGGSQQQHYLPSSSAPSPQYGHGPSYSGYQAQQVSTYPPQPHYLPSYPPQIQGGGIPFPFSGPTPNPLFTAPPIHFGGGQPGPFNPQHITTASTGHQQQPPPFLLPPTQQQQPPGGTQQSGGVRTINDLLN